MVSLILQGRIFFILDNAKTAPEALFFDWWRLQLRFLSKWTPTNFKNKF